MADAMQVLGEEILRKVRQLEYYVREGIDGDDLKMHDTMILLDDLKQIGYSMTKPEDFGWREEDEKLSDKK